NCGQIISSEIEKCKFCSFEITQKARESAIEKESAEKKGIFLKNQKNSLIMGIVMVAIGFGLFLNPIVSARWGSTEVPCLSPILIPLGIGIIILSLIGYLREKRK
ncbi:MAG: hypothetical protein ABJB40_05705, partial [Acidobacteriota bacterium]